jgi:cellulose synthase/poly-beta-1,6-N-acetylglucosamine synthase-like glycosyltransferase
VGTLKSVSSFWHTPFRLPTRLIIVAYYLLIPVYLVWLGGSFLSWEHPFIALSFLLSETAIVSVFLLLTYICWKPTVRQIHPPVPNLSVDVYITTYNEDLEVLRQSIRHCLAMDYPHETYVLDDGCRPDVERLALALGARYIGRKDRSHAKAGNMNHALARTSGEFVALFDADGIPKKNFLTETLGYFRNPRTAIVQGNQMIYNLDSFQHSPFVQRDDLWTEQSIFWDIIQSGKDRLGGLTWCGSGSVLRRAALEEVGGVATDTVTEDFHTSLRLQARGYEVAYHPEVLSYCLGPRDFASFIGQRNRWSMGTLQSIKQERHLIFGKSKLTFSQRVCALAAFSYYFESAIKVLSFFLPGMVLCAGGVAIDGGYASVLILFQVWLLRGLLFYLVSRGRGSNRIVGAYWYVKMWPYLRNLVRAFTPVKQRFFVTPKDPFQVANRPQMGSVLGTIYCISCIGGACLLSINGMMNPGLVFVAFAGLYHMRVCLEAVRLQVRGSWVPDSYAFLGCFPVEFRNASNPRGASGTTRLVSRTELWLLGSHEFEFGETIEVDLRIGQEVLRSTAVVVECARVLPRTEWSLNELKVRLPELPSEKWDVVFDYCLAVGPDRLIQRNPSKSAQPSAVPAEARRANFHSPELLPGASVGAT